MNNTALITWASSGLGKEFAYIHAKKWNDLVLVARRSHKLELIKSDIESKYKVSVHVISKDLTADSAVKDIYKEIVENHISIEYLINNAGFGWVWKFSKRPWENELSMIQLNIIALTELCYMFLPDMLSRNSWKILNVSSTASLIPGPNQAVYYATKAFVTSLSNAISSELHDSKVTVSALLPWAVETEFWAVSGMDKTSLFEWAVSAQGVAQAWYDGMMSGKLNIIAGLKFPQNILVKMIPFLPKKLLLKIVREWQELR